MTATMSFTRQRESNEHEFGNSSEALRAELGNFGTSITTDQPHVPEDQHLFPCTSCGRILNGQTSTLMLNAIDPDMTLQAMPYHTRDGMNCLGLNSFFATL
jgi:hypothetical protein